MEKNNLIESTEIVFNQEHFKNLVRYVRDLEYRIVSLENYLIAEQEEFLNDVEKDL